MPRNIVSAKKEKAVKYKVTLVSRGVYWGRRALFRGKVRGFLNHWGIIEFSGFWARCEFRV